MPPFSMEAQKILNGDRLSIARALTEIEKNSERGNELLKELYAHTGKAHLIGITGSPGTGKSTFVNQLVKCFREQAESKTDKVAIIAVDPSSPFTGGAILGDRIRMRDLLVDKGIYIRSMASRGTLGGLASATSGFVQVFDAAGYSKIIIETVGAGQDEVDIAKLAHTTIVIEAPGFGDDIQAIKAGILEIADILIVNKADRPDADSTVRVLEATLNLGMPTPRELAHHGEINVTSHLGSELTKNSWIPPILKTISTKGNGIEDVVLKIHEHKEYLLRTGEWKQRDRVRLSEEVRTQLVETLYNDWRASTDASTFQEIIDMVARRELSPAEAVEELLKREVTNDS